MWEGKQNLKENCESKLVETEKAEVRSARHREGY